jgi:TatD DNase family protein
VIDFVDTHAHLQEAEFDDDRDAVIQRAMSAGVRQVVVPAVDLDSAGRSVSLADRHAGVYATAGFHPHEAAGASPEALSAIEELLGHPKAVAVGEIGLDWFRMLSPRETQIAALEAQLAIAASHALPIVIHCRDAWDDLRPLLEPWAKRAADRAGARPLGVLHYFSGSLEDARLYQELGFLISVHTSVTHPKAQGLREVVATLPLEALVIETDSPYGAPQAYRGKRNEPAYVVETAKQIALLKGVELEAVAAATTANAGRLFGLSRVRQNEGAMGVRG